MKQEIERKFVVENVPAYLLTSEPVKIWQNYLVTAEGVEARIRHTECGCCDKFMFTMKVGQGLKRKEYEIELAESEYIDLNNSIDELPLFKRRWSLSEDMVLDLYKFPFGDTLAIVEVEFSSEDKANDFAPPNWVSAEVTGLSAYSNSALWRRYQ